MPSHSEVRHVPFPPQAIYDLVAEVETYPQFLPWCVGVRVRNRTPETFMADLIIGFKMLREKYTSRVHLDPAHLSIRIEYLEGPFRHLENHWQFKPTADGGTDIHFHIDFEFKSRLLQGLIGKMFGEAVSVMVGAFEKRARALYGKG